MAADGKKAECFNILNLGTYNTANIVAVICDGGIIQVDPLGYHRSNLRDLQKFEGDVQHSMLIR